MFTYSPAKAALLAVVQVWVITMGTLACALNTKLSGDFGGNTQWPTRVLSHFGFSLVWIPLIWICVASVVRLRPKISESRKELAFQTGWWLLLTLVGFVAYGVLQPWLGPRYVDVVGME